MGMRAALVAFARSRGVCTAASRSCSALVVYRSWPVTPRSIQPKCGGFAGTSKKTCTRLAEGRDGPRTAPILTIFHFPRSLPTNATGTVPEGYVPRFEPRPVGRDSLRTHWKEGRRYITLDR